MHDHISSFIEKTSQSFGLSPESEFFYAPAKCCKRDIMSEVLSSSSISFGENGTQFRVQDVFPDLGLISILYLRSFLVDAWISAENYEDRPGFSAALSYIDPDFEFPTWDGRKIAEFLRHEDFGGRIDAVPVRFFDLGSCALFTDATTISRCDFEGARPFSDNGWEFASGERLYLRLR